MNDGYFASDDGHLAATTKRCFKINNHGNMVLQEILDSASALEIE